MLVATSSFTEFSQSSDVKASILEAIGDQLDGVEIFNSDVMVATFIRPNVTKGGIYLTDKQTQEDQYQGKVGLVLKLGPSAFNYKRQFDHVGLHAQVGDWVVYRASDGWEVFLRDVRSQHDKSKGIHVRFIDSEHIRAITDDPMKFY